MNGFSRMCDAAFWAVLLRDNLLIDGFGSSRCHIYNRLVNVYIVMDGRKAQRKSACLKTKRSAVQASAMASCCGGELFTYI